MNRKKRSIVWQLPDDKFIELIKNSNRMSAVLKFFNLENKGGNFLTCKKRIKELGLDISHFLNRIESSKISKTKSLEEFLKILTTNSNYRRESLKINLIKYNLLEYKCAKCQNSGEWNHKKLSLHIDHINGVSSDNTLSNLQFLCPNYHSQTENYAGKNIRKKQYICKICTSVCSKVYAGKCGNCRDEYRVNPQLRVQPQKRKVKNRPAKEELEQMIKITPMVTIALQYGVQDNTVRKWAISYGIDIKATSPFCRNKSKHAQKLSRL